MSKHSCICWRSSTVGCGRDQDVRKTTNSHTKKKKPIVSSASLRLFTAVRCVSAPVQTTSADFGVHAFIYYAHSFCMLETTTDIWPPLWLRHLPCSTEGEMELRAGPLQCLGTLHGTDRAWARVNLFNLAQARFVRRARAWTWLSSH